MVVCVRLVNSQGRERNWPPLLQETAWGLFIRNILPFQNWEVLGKMLEDSLDLLVSCELVSFDDGGGEGGAA